MLDAVLIAAGCATVGWLYTARRARTVGRKQHTVNIMLTAGFNERMHDALTAIGNLVRDRNLPDLVNAQITEEQAILLKHLRLVLNHYEFVCSGIRNGDIDERLVRDSEGGTIQSLFIGTRRHIADLRLKRNRPTTYEHLEWLYKRWYDDPPSTGQRCIEFLLARPFAGKRARDV